MSITIGLSVWATACLVCGMTSTTTICVPIPRFDSLIPFQLDGDQPVHSPRCDLLLFGALADKTFFRCMNESIGSVY